MGTLAASAELWTAVGTAIATLVLLVPAVVYAWVVIEGWLADDDSYARITSSVLKR